VSKKRKIKDGFWFKVVNIVPRIDSPDLELPIYCVEESKEMALYKFNLAIGQKKKCDYIGEVKSGIIQSTGERLVIGTDNKPVKDLEERNN